MAKKIQNITDIKLNKVDFAPSYFTWRYKGKTYGGPKGSTESTPLADFMNLVFKGKI